MIDPSPRWIVYCYGEYQQLFDKYPRVDFRQGLPDLQNFNGGEPVLLVIDDLMDATDGSVANLFTKGSHHRNVSVVFLVQNLFHKNKHVRTISLNSQYMVLFKNPRDASQFASLARQMYPNRSAFAVEAYKDATQQPYSYLFATFDRSRTKIYVCGLIYFPTRTDTSTYRNERTRQKVPVPAEAYTQTW